MRVLLENAGISFPPARLAGVSTVMRTLPPQPPEGHQRRDAVVMKVWRLHALREVHLLFNLREKCRCVFRTHAVSIKSNSSPSRTMRPLTGRPRHQTTALRYATNTIGNLVKVGPLLTGISLTVGYSPLARNGADLTCDSHDRRGHVDQ